MANHKSLGQGELLAAISRRRSKRLRNRALAAAKRGLNSKQIAERAAVSVDLAQEVLAAYRRSALPNLVNDRGIWKHRHLVGVRTLAELHAMSMTRVRTLLQRSGVGRIPAVLPSGRFCFAYDEEHAEKSFSSASVRKKRLEKYRKMVASLKIKKYGDLTDYQMATLLGLLVLLRESGGFSPTYAEIEEAAGLPSRAGVHSIPVLEKLGYIKREPILNPRQGQAIYRIIVQRAPAKLVSKPIKCPNCHELIWVSYDWYQPRNGNGTSH